MTNRKHLPSILGTTFLLACFLVSALGQTAEDKNRVASMTPAGSSVRWDVSTPHSGATITISAPDGRTFQKESKGSSLDFSLTDKNGERLPDGVYNYEIRLAPSMSAGQRESLAKARGKDDEPETVRAARKRTVLPGLVESGSFSVVNGSVVVGGIEEGSGSVGKVQTAPVVQPRSAVIVPASVTKLHHPRRVMSPDDVIPDDLIVQGSACVGLDCVNGEVFGFDTIRLKENNTRLQFDDTSGAGFPTNNWQIRANSSGGGGQAFLGFVDQGSSGNSETGTIVFEVDAGAPANSLRVSSTGRVGLRTGTPVLDLHITTSDTPAHRLEQTNAGGFSAQTWDVAGNEANFFVRDVTGGSLLPFRIRPGAPTSSLDISADGDVGIGISSPARDLHVHSTISDSVLLLTNSTSGATASDGLQIIQAGANSFFENQEAGTMTFRTSATDRMTITSAGNVGIATAAPTDTLSVNGTASKPGGGSWAVFSDERLKSIKGSFSSGLDALMRLQPLRFEYKPGNVLGLKSAAEHVGFSAQAVQQLIPEAVTRNENGYLQINNDPIIWTMLNAIKEQQKEIQQLRTEVRKLRATRKRR